MSSAADRSVRILLTACSTGYPKILPVLLESCSNKVPTMRKSALDYMCLAATVWKSDAFERQLSGLKVCIKVGVADADPGVRRSARQLYW